MSVDTSSGNSESIEAIAEEMSEDRAALLAAVARSDGEGIETGQLRRETGVPSGSMHYHMDALAEWGLVEVVGRGENDGGIPPQIYGITERGQEFLAHSGTRTFPTAEEVRDLHERVEELESKRTADRKRIEELESEIERMQDAYNDMVDVIRDLDEGQTPES